MVVNLRNKGTRAYGSTEGVGSVIDGEKAGIGGTYQMISTIELIVKAEGTVIDTQGF